MPSDVDEDDLPFFASICGIGELFHLIVACFNMNTNGVWSIDLFIQLIVQFLCLITKFSNKLFTPIAPSPLYTIITHSILYLRLLTSAIQHTNI